MLKILTLNIGNPSIDRAKRQVLWLEQREEDVFILTETKNSEGCNYIEDYFKNYGFDLFSIGTSKKYYVFFPKSKTGDLGTMIISKIPFKSTFTIFDEDSIFYSRACGCEIEYNGQSIKMLGLYVPSRDASVEKINRKKEFCAGVANFLKINQMEIVAGDLNILQREHVPHYSTFLDFEYRFYEFFVNLRYIDAWKSKNDKLEYSWVGRTNDGYRYDYIFVNDALGNSINSCEFLHQTRTTNKITDHSAVKIDLDV